MFTSEEREEIRASLVSAARADGCICGAAHLGSAAIGALDSWSDIDFALCLAPDADLAETAARWTSLLYDQHHAVTHYDVNRGGTLYRVFLLSSTLQVDISFWNAAEFRAFGQKFQLIFGAANEPRPAPLPETKDLIGMAWLYALHVRSSLARRRMLQAEYMLSGMRNEMLALACRRHGVAAIQARGVDDLPQEFRLAVASCFPCSLDPSDMVQAFSATTAGLLAEIGYVDAELKVKLASPLNDLVSSLGSKAEGKEAAS